LAVLAPPDPATSSRPLPRRIGVEPLADIVAPAEGRAETSCPRIGVEALELFEPASPRDKMFCTDAPQRRGGVGPDAADRTAADQHAAVTPSAGKKALM
jgi:hypothetical protein